MLMVPNALNPPIMLFTRTKRSSLNFLKLLKPETSICAELQRLSITLKPTCAVLEMSRPASNKSNAS